MPFLSCTPNCQLQKEVEEELMATYLFSSISTHPCLDISRCEISTRHGLLQNISPSPNHSTDIEAPKGLLTRSTWVWHTFLRSPRPKIEIGFLFFLQTYLPLAFVVLLTNTTIYTVTQTRNLDIRETSSPSPLPFTSDHR